MKFMTAGESHGKGLCGIIEGIPANLSLSSQEIDKELKRRQSGFGRGGRMKIESDHAEILSGVRWGKTLGSPITILIENADHKNWLEGMSADAAAQGSIPPVTRPRPGHADLAGAIKYDQRDIRNVLERSSARETAVRVACGAIAKRFLSEFGIGVGSYVTQIGNEHAALGSQPLSGRELLGLFDEAEASPVRCPDQNGAHRMVALIEKALKEGNSLGGVFEVFVTGAPAGLGSYIQWDRRLDGRLAQALMSVQAIKGVEVGAGFALAGRPGSEVMDEIFYDRETSNVKRERIPKTTSHVSRLTSHGFYRRTNNAGGIEGGMTNGMPVIVRAAMKPIPTLRTPLGSVDIITKEAFEAAYERSDVCAVPAASVVGEAMTALTVADAFIEKFGGDSMEEVMRNYKGHLEYVKRF
ncbi:MAG TPA: chorismate synthase [Thermodesulfovibrionales bacterium]|nr:chorismate synthase [Thermodesulfovibrionales bacterium]